MINWVYSGSVVTEVSQLPVDTVGFVYNIINTISDKFYIGKKNIRTFRTKALTKKELASLTDKRLSKKKKVISESDWLTYMGSDDELKEDIKKYGENNFHREILHVCNSKMSLTYQEVRYQFLNKVLESSNCYNKQVLGKFYKNKVA